ncbi:hydrogenase iron-sulfur subunit [Desulfonatronum sp. SC1]|uniref:hydrogenase iron-sulfur subunit n=1 Tax=Desulfonatronum sp. SC1 TaxID=2109626 RepID=UPI000D318CC9|nr:hydrogenase iron-sulfur subunit [Desulfonatronum sp. SC1]PTN39014.1 heterodisulfide reductase subunit A [Desulfonatronum sp. SC1]
MSSKIGVYICEGCDIGPQLNAGQLAEFVQSEYGGSCPVIKTAPVLCSQEGKAMIQADVDAETIDGVAVCACSPRVKWDVFQFGEKTVVERVNLREQCAWTYARPEADTTAEGEVPETLRMMAQDYIRMGIIKLQKYVVPQPEIPEVTRTILVVGGGNTGLTAALGGAKLGYDVVLLEKQGQLGGFAAQMYKQVPYTFPYTQAVPTGVEKKINDVSANDKIRVFTGSTLNKLEGAPGQYTAVIATGNGEERITVGSVVLATGWKPFDPEARVVEAEAPKEESKEGEEIAVVDTPEIQKGENVLAPLGHGKFTNVITNVDMELMAKKGELLRPSDGRPVQSVAFIQCAGQRSTEEGHLPYCSSVCCMVSLKQAGYLREKNPNGKAFIIYKDMIVPGLQELYYKAAQDDPGIFLTKGDVIEVKEDSDGGIIIQAENTLLGEPLEIKVDVLVLATGMVPTTLADPVMNFAYRQGPAFPDLNLFNGFADSNYICFPYETRRTGVYSAGCVHQPMLMGAAEDDASGAVLKAIQCLESINRGMAVHPRSGDISFPKFNMVRCTQCKRCTEECPFGALDDDEKGTPQPNPTRCRRCGTCMGACPERVISFEEYNVDMIASMIKENEVPDDIDEGGPRVIVFVCENDAYPALDMAAFQGKKWSPYVRFISVRCLGSINSIWVADSMSKGIDGVLLLGCKYGDDYQCHFAKGSELCNKRMENIAETLGRLQLEPERVQQKQVAIDEYDKIPQMIDDFMNHIIDDIGANPYKGF